MINYKHDAERQRKQTLSRKGTKIKSWKQTIESLAANKNINSAADVRGLVPSGDAEYLWDRIQYYREFGEVI